ncbi:MAG TPA: ABC transporter permease [Rhizomicrobium sp.]|nr:ABC transporter permease [Rhizomicrobium sp.]
MKYFPLVWAAIMRKPVRAVLTLLSVMIAFTLFGLTIGMNATFDTVEENAHNDRLYTNPRFSNNGLPVAVAEQIKQLPGVGKVAYRSFIGGYHQDPKNRVFIFLLNPDMRQVMSDWPLTARQWDMIQQNRTGIVISKIAALQWKLKPGDKFTVTAPLSPKADGSTSWDFQVLDVSDDIAYMTGGYMMGNFDYLDKARPAASQGRAGQFLVLASDPSRSTDLAEQIDEHFANSATPTQSITEKAAFDVSNSGLDIAAVDRDIAFAGMFMVLFLTANGIARSVRERFGEFAMLRTLGYSDNIVMALVFFEAALPSITGAVLGVGLAALVSRLLPHFFPPGNGIPLPTMTASVFLWAGLGASLVALASTALPALRLRQMDIATALSGR